MQRLNSLFVEADILRAQNKRQRILIRILVVIAICLIIVLIILLSVMINA
jgi:hypothetical protein